MLLPLLHHRLTSLTLPGIIGQRWTQHALDEPLVDLTCIVDPTAYGEEFAKERGLTLYKSVEGMLEAKEEGKVKVEGALLAVRPFLSSFPFPLPSPLLCPFRPFPLTYAHHLFSHRLPTLLTSLSAFNSSKPASPPSSRSLSQPTASPDVVSSLLRRVPPPSSSLDSTVVSCVAAFPSFGRCSKSKLIFLEFLCLEEPLHRRDQVPSRQREARKGSCGARCLGDAQGSPQSRSSSPFFALRTNISHCAQPADYFEGPTSWRKAKGTGGVVLINLVHEYVASSPRFFPLFPLICLPFQRRPPSPSVRQHPSRLL
jgi:hypothetical protein